MSLSPEELEVIIEHSPTLIWKSNTDRSIGYFSNSWLQFRGRTLEEERIDGWQDGVHPEDLDACMEAYNRHFDQLLPFEIQYRLKRHDGVYRWMLDKGTPHFDASNNFTGYIGYCFDITDQKQIEAALTQERERLTGILEGTNSGTWEWNVQTGETIFNERWAEIIGYTLEELAPVSLETWIKHCHPEDLKKSNQSFEPLFNRETDYYECEVRMLHKNGKWVWVLDRGKVTTWTKDGKPLLVMGTHQDITERKASEEKLAKSENKYRELVENTTDIIYSLNAKGEFTYVSNAWKRLLGHAPHEVQGKSFTNFVHPDDIELCTSVLQRVFLKGERITGVEYRVRHKNGSWRWHSSSGNAKKNEAGEVLLFDGLAHDITQQKEDEGEISKQAAIQKLLIKLGANFINNDSDEVSGAIHIALKDLGEFLEVDRVKIFHYDWEKSTINNIYEWCGKGMASELENSQNIPIDGIPQYVNKHKRGETLKIFDTQAPSVQKELQDILLPQGIKSIMTIPLMLDEACIGFIGFDSVTHKRAYSRAEEDMLIVFSNMLANVSQRQLVQEQLLNSRGTAEQHAKELREAQKIARLGNWYLNLETGITVWSEELYQMYGYDPSEPPPPFAEQEKIFTPESWQRLNQAAAKAWQEGTPYELELNFVRPGKSIGWVWGKGEAVFDKDNNIIGLRGVAQDVTKQKENELQIAKQTAIQKILISLASRFVNIQLEEVSDSIDSALKDLGEFFKVDRAYVFNYNWEDQTTSNTYEWCAQDIEPEIEHLQNVPVNVIPQWVTKHKQGENLKIFDTLAPTVEKALQEILLPQGIKSIITIPLMMNKECIGFVGFDSVKQKRDYSRVEEEMLIVFANMLVNISKRQLAQEQLLRSRETAEQIAKELQEAQKIASLASWYYDLESDEVTWSEELYRMYGFDPSLPPPPYPEQEKIFTPESWERLSRSVGRAGEKGNPYELELNFVRPDKSKGWMWAKGEAVVNQDKKIIGLRGVAQDITKRKELEIELQKSKERHEAAAKRLQVASTSAGLGIWEWDILENKLLWDDRMYELYGYVKGETKSSFEAWSGRIHPDDLDRALEDVNNALSGKREFDTSFRIVHSDGNEFYIKGFAYVARDKNDVALKMIGVNMDVSKSQLYQRSLESKNKQLIDFSNIVAHNLRAPLVNIELLTNLIDESEDPEESRAFVTQLKSVIVHLNEVFNELMESIQIRQDTDIESVQIDLNERIDKAIKGINGQIDANRAEISIDVASAPKIKYPSKYIDSILSNLISNALKYRSPKRSPEIAIKTEKVNNDVILSVTDNGLGLDMNLAKKNLFKIRKVFHKHPDARGFGLFLIKTQIDAMDGDIWVESEPDKGSTFFVKFKNSVV